MRVVFYSDTSVQKTGFAAVFVSGQNFICCYFVNQLENVLLQISTSVQRIMVTASTNVSTRWDRMFAHVTMGTLSMKMDTTVKRVVANMKSLHPAENWKVLIIQIIIHQKR